MKAYVLGAHMSLEGRNKSTAMVTVVTASERVRLDAYDDNKPGGRKRT